MDAHTHALYLLSLSLSLSLCLALCLSVFPPHSMPFQYIRVYEKARGRALAMYHHLYIMYESVCR